jgi:hypothetical protein
MPLLDHFHPPLKAHRPWEGFHYAWATVITQQLNRGVLPERYFAVPNTKMGSQIEIDVATFQEEGNGIAGSAAGGVATAVYAPPRPPLVELIDFDEIDVFEVQVLRDEGPGRLIAAVELISPANKDRASHRQAFTSKCASYLQQGISVIVVDIVTDRSGNLHAELLSHLNLAAQSGLQGPDQLYAVAYRVARKDEQSRLEAWPHLLTLGSPLPTLPLWLGAEYVVPLNLEPSYLATCESLRIRV